VSLPSAFPLILSEVAIRDAALRRLLTVRGKGGARLSPSLNGAIPAGLAVAAVAGSDFLSPIGHRCNTLALARPCRLAARLALSSILLVVGVPIMVSRPLRRARP
jgi:hypothetical protein